MSWEAFRLTSKSPAEVLHVLGPHGVDDLIRKAMDAVWREYPEETRSYEAVKQRVVEVFQRNLRHWSTIKKPTPAAFFENLLPYTADGHVRQAMVLTWMMMPRAGGRDFKDVKKIVAQILERNLAAWDEDYRTFTGSAAKPKRAPTKKKPTAKAAKRATKPAGKVVTKSTKPVKAKTAPKSRS
jgi:hypothetical protein